MSKTKIALSRKAIVMDIGGFRPPEDPLTSWFGKVNLALPEESWPHSGGTAMYALCQINLLELPFKPPLLDDLAMITVFIDSRELPVDQPNGQNWCLRAYQDLSLLRPLEQNKERSPIKALPMKARVVKDDFPCLDDAENLGVDIDDEDEYQEKYPHVEGFKLGGWPSLIQSEVSWDLESIDPQYVFQIASSEKGHWQWGHGGVGYFGRGRAAGCEDDWVLSWQCF